MSKLIMKPKHFNIPISHNEMMGMAKCYEYESQLCWMLTKYIENNIPFDKSIKCTYNHPAMVKHGYLELDFNTNYKLTRKSLGLLWSAYGK